jgi:hypothetical protein
MPTVHAPVSPPNPGGMQETLGDFFEPGSPFGIRWYRYARPSADGSLASELNKTASERWPLAIPDRSREESD